MLTQMIETTLGVGIGDNWRSDIAGEIYGRIHPRRGCFPPPESGE